jgi:hypothetical protein
VLGKVDGATGASPPTMSARSAAPELFAPDALVGRGHG